MNKTMKNKISLAINLSLFPFRTRGHYTVEGYKNISKIISDNLKNQKSKWVRPNEIFKT